MIFVSIKLKTLVLLDKTTNIPLVFVCDMINKAFLLAGIGSTNRCFYWVRILLKPDMIWGKFETKYRSEILITDRLNFVSWIHIKYSIMDWHIKYANMCVWMILRLPLLKPPIVCFNIAVVNTYTPRTKYQDKTNTICITDKCIMALKWYHS